MKFWRAIPPEGLCAIGCAAAILFFWVTQPTPPGCISPDGLVGWYGIRDMVCGYKGPVMRVILPSGKLVDIWPGHVFAPPEGYSIDTLYDQSGHDHDMRSHGAMPLLEQASPFGFGNRYTSIHVDESPMQ